MSGFLWKFFLEDDVDRFRRLLADAAYVAAPHAHQKGHHFNAGSHAGRHVAVGASASTGTSKHRRIDVGLTGPGTGTRTKEDWSALILTRLDVNLQDRNGLTVLHHAASSSAPNAAGFAIALVDHPLVDLYLQDAENGWTALHRALYFGNITVARAIMHRDMLDAVGHGRTSLAIHPGSIIRVKDIDGNVPLDLLYETIRECIPGQKKPIAGRETRNDKRIDDVGHEDDQGSSTNDSDSASGEDNSHTSYNLKALAVEAKGDEVFMFGSNKNFNLGFGDQDDRQHPERATLRRPDHLLYRFYYEQQQRARSLSELDRPFARDVATPNNAALLPALVRSTALIIHDVIMSKLHTAILTTDPEANLYMCGYGPGGRLGTGDETTRFTFVCIEGGGLAGKKVWNVGLGQNHTLAVTDDGDIFTWGTNTYGQLGYALPKPNLKDQEPIQTSPRQLFGPLKKETVIGTAASRIHSAVYTKSSLFTFGKNEGQLGLMDSDARSLEVQPVPRRVGVTLFASPIDAVAAIDRATICLLENHEVWVFANFGYAKINFPLDGFPNDFLKASKNTTKYDNMPNFISKICAGGETICALSRTGDVFAVQVHQRLDPVPMEASTTNPNKIRTALTPAQRVWSSTKQAMAVRDFSLSLDGSVIICTRSGSVWKRVKRVKIDDARATGKNPPRSKDYKFSRVPGLTRVVAVRSNVFGSFAAIRRDCGLAKGKTMVGRSIYRQEIASLLPFWASEAIDNSENDNAGFTRSGVLTPGVIASRVQRLALLSAKLDLEIAAAIARCAASAVETFDAEVSTSSSEIKIPVHGFMLQARSPVLRRILREPQYMEGSLAPAPLSVTRSSSGKVGIEFENVDLVCLLTLVLYLYTDEIIQFWLLDRDQPKQRSRLNHVRSQLVELASRLELREFEKAVRSMRTPVPNMDLDLRHAMADPSFFDDADTVIELDGATVRAHRAILCQRCPFFEGLFQGRAAGKWLSTRHEETGPETGVVRIDLGHMDPEAFDLVLRYLYSDGGLELFDHIVSTDLDELLDIVVEVMSVANELMIERLCQICQQVLGRFVNPRNACQLLNAVAPCSATAFKETCLEYVCVNLEVMLENHLLDDLDDDLLCELDGVVKANQRRCLPFVRGKALVAPSLSGWDQVTEARARERQSKIDYAALVMKGSGGGNRMPGSRDTTAYSVDVFTSSPALRPSRGKTSSGASSASQSPLIRPQSLPTDAMFDMDEDDEMTTLSRDGSSRRGPNHPPRRGWSTPSLPLEKLDMKAIMAQTTSKRSSSLSQDSSMQDQSGSKSPGTFGGKLSQRERKRQQQQQKHQSPTPTPQPSTDDQIPVSKEKSRSPWLTPVAGPKISLKDVFHLEDRQIAGQAPSTQSSTLGEDGASIHHRSGNTDISQSSSMDHATVSSAILTPTDPVPIRTSRHHPSELAAVSSSSIHHTLAEPALQLSMADIISQQEAELEMRKQAVAKRPLAEIQQEQEFMEWWDAESRKAYQYASPVHRTIAAYN
ncbi:MAG: hypothetical protein M1826_003754 [Phylliscum demangeonii]|nr:MAG: hypothetical protein M1826_003754 [Phylliscum demangeonii]